MMVNLSDRLKKEMFCFDDNKIQQNLIGFLCLVLWVAMVVFLLKCHCLHKHSPSSSSNLTVVLPV